MQDCVAIKNLNTLSTVSTNSNVNGTLMKINCTIFRFLDQTLWAFEDALQTGELLSFRVIRHFSIMLFYLFILINLSL